MASDEPGVIVPATNEEQVIDQSDATRRGLKQLGLGVHC
jgi:hypothetical protein